MIDIGVNLTNSRFDKDRQQIINKAIAIGVSHQIVTGTSAQESRDAYELTQSHACLYSTAGCHPHDADAFSDKDLSLIRDLLRNDTVVAVGETGLDFNRNFSTPENQIRVFHQQLQLAEETAKPLFLHERDAHEEFIQVIAQYPAVDAVVHCFTGAQKSLETYLDKGFLIGITGWVCDERRGKNLADIVPIIPDDRLMIETDAPYLLPRSLKPKPKSNRNLPEYLPHIAQTIADLRQQPLEHLIKITRKNTIKFFDLPIDSDNL